jgi:hypothetical protein
LTNSTTNWLIFDKCAFSSTFTIPSTFGGYAVFYNCDFAGSTMTLNNLSSLQIQFSSCSNLPSLSLNANYLGFNSTTQGVTINAYSVNVTGSTSFPSGSVSMSSIGGLSSALALKSDITYVDNKIASLVSSAPTTLDTLNELATALGNDPNFATTMTNSLASKAGLSANNIYTGTNTFTNGLTTNQLNATAISLNSQDLNTRLTTDETNITSHTNSISSINSNITTIQSNVSALQNKTNALSYDSGTNTTTINSKLKVNLDDQLNGNTIIGDQSTDTLTVNAVTTFNNTVNGITKSMVGLANVDNTSDVNKPVSSATQTALNAKQNTLTFDSAPTQNSTNPVSSGGLYTTLAGYLLIATATSTYATIASLANYVTNTSLTSTLGSYLTTASASSTYQPILLYDTTPTQNSTKSINSGSLYSFFQLYVTITSLTSTLASYVTNSSLATQLVNYVTNTSLSTTLGSYLTTASASSTYQTISGMANYVTNTSLANTLGSYLTTASASTTYQTISGMANYVTSASLTTQLGSYLSTTSASSTYQTISGMANYVTSASLTTQLANYVTSASLTTQLANYVTNTSLSTTLGSYVTSASLTTQLGNYLTTSSASSLYQTISGMSSYLTTTSASATYAPINNASLTGQTTVTEVAEQINTVTGVTTSLALSYTTCKGINYIQTPTANFSLALTNIPTTSTNATYTITLVIPAKFYCNTITVNTTTYSMISGGGLANISINTSATYIIQQVNIMFLNSSTPTIMTNVISCF